MTPQSRKAEWARHLTDLMQGFASVQARPMFGGHGLFREGKMFALVAGDALYFKVDAQTVDAFTALGLPPFQFTARGKSVALRYHLAPAEVHEDPQAMRLWCARAWEATVRAQGDPGRKPGRVAPARPTARAGRGGRHVAGGDDLLALRNLGPRSVAMLAQAGIQTEAQLRALGAVRALVLVQAACQTMVSLNLLWALEGALSDRPWQQVAQQDRASLLMALEDAQRHPA